jgi:hypothetical protein
VRGGGRDKMSVKKDWFKGGENKKRECVLPKKNGLTAMMLPPPYGLRGQVLLKR